MNTVIFAVAVLLVLGAAFGAILAFAAKVFHVEKDPKEEAIVGCLPGANCGGCGFPGCAGYAAAVAAGKAETNKCAAGGEAVAAQIAEIMGVSGGASVKQLAVVHCTGCGVQNQKYVYQGVQDCLAASRLAGGGSLACDFGCLGYGTCQKVCPFDAIHVKDGVAKVDQDKCKACGKCVEACPKHLITLEPFKTKRHVTIPCSSKAKGPAVTKSCSNGCIGCGLCAKACPKQAIAVDSFLAKINYDLCVGCGLCAQACPRNLITVDGVVPEKRPKPAPKPAAAAAPKAEAPKPAAPKQEG